MSEKIDFLQLKKNLRSKKVDGKGIKIAVLGNSSTQLLSIAIKGYGLEYGLNLELFEAEYNQIEQEIYNPNSDLYEYQPDFVFIVLSERTFWKKFSKSEVTDKNQFADKQLKQVQDWVLLLSQKLNSTVLITNIAEFDDNIFGSYATKQNLSFIYQLDRKSVV